MNEAQSAPPLDPDARKPVVTFSLPPEETTVPASKVATVDVAACGANVIAELLQDHAER